MTEKVDNSNSYFITPSLLNSWGYIWECVKNVKSLDNDVMCLEDKIEKAQKEAYESFLNSLNRISSPPNEYMKAGIEFEEECYKGNTCISPIIENGCFQVVGKKYVEVCGMNFLMYGRLDVLKGGKIYDIKRVFSYSPQKYIGSFQHRFYLDLFPNAKEFEYLIYDGRKLHKEKYLREDCIPTENIINEFIVWLKEHNLLEIYKEKWKANNYGK